MTTYFSVQLSTVGAPQFTPTLDGTQYTCVVRWNLQGQRFFLDCYDNNRVLKFSRPVVKSPIGQQIEALSFDLVRSVVNGSTPVPHGYSIGQTMKLTISGAVPSDYNGTFEVLVTSDSAFSYPLQFSSDPGAATSPGLLSYDISLCAGFFSSTLVLRNGQFEVNP